ncbi:RagB/SusD family nutrient uptake outer membrane protein [Pseudoflavitalea sp. X16]|uniref:RagB/SusD family nutrient uptake outer membrane protein n=1 Tax=Paraflavitalea devenefica TaxID=2716334 RepID=UPI0014211B37|nr:RagB/SusD family nutrient uptake outer membrane protein [Paraflavitalea devenefica]NII29730.1 RagB/SusD family nutrient uptake outer membrane protein [Paraflavitalea devenefica]
MKLIYRIIIPLLFVLVCTSGCQKSFLDRPSLSQITSDNFYQSTSDLRLATAALYGGATWFDYNSFPYLGVGDVLSGNLLQPYNPDLVQFTTFSITGDNGQLAGTWRSFYKIVGQCNVTIKAIRDKAPATIPAKDINAALAEARFVRATVYFHLVQLWGAVPIIEDNTKLIDSPLLRRNIVSDVYKFIASDLTFAAKNLPASDAAGRVTTWSAQGMLSKIYLTWAGLNQNMTRNQALLDSAKLYAGNVCNKSGLSLLSSYYNLFRTQYNNSQESLFALQWAPGVGYGLGNALQAQFAPSGDLVTGGGGWGGAIGPTYDLYTLYTQQDSVRRKASFMLTGDFYPELNAAGGGYRATSCNLKKHVVGTAADNNSPTMDLWSSIEHNALLRLADVYLVYAEAILGNNASTTDAEALKYFNKVRTRAGVDPAPLLDADTLFRERRIELVYESQFWFDLVRLSYYNPQKAIDALKNQKRQLFTYSNGIATPTPYNVAITPPTIYTFTLPIPATELTADPKLSEPPVAYY